MRVICHQNEVGLRFRADPLILGWLQDDEPDNAQPKAGGGYGPPVAPAAVVREYERLRAADPSRPVLLNLGQGVAWDGWRGRGVRTNRPEDYPLYARGADIVSFDIYPVASTDAAVHGRLDFVGRGVARLVRWAEGRPVWNVVGASRISHPRRRPTPEELRSQVWMSLIHGSRGIIYFVHEWVPRFREASILEEPDLLEALTALNREITRLAPVLNSPTLEGRARATTPRDPAGEVALLAKAGADGLHVFVVEMRGRETAVRLAIPGAAPDGAREWPSGRRLALREGVFEDTLAPWQARIYAVRP